MVQLRVARTGFAVVAVVAAVALLLQLGLIVSGVAALVPEQAPPLPLALLRFVGYFTIQSNVLVLVTGVQLVRDPGRDGRAWRVVRADAVIGITVTGLVHFFLLRPLLDLHGASGVADALLHLAVPILAVLSWLLLGPRPRTSVRTVAWALLWPVAWVVVVSTIGWVTRWYPYPFLDAHVLGAGPVVVACLAITALFLLLGALLLLGDRRLSPTRPQPTELSEERG